MKWMWLSNPPAVKNAPFACDRFGTGADDDVDARLRVGIACFADLVDATVAQPNVSLVDA